MAQLGGDAIAFFGGRKAVRPSLAISLFQLLQNTGNPDLNKLVEIVGGDGQKLKPLQQGVAGILSFLKHAAVKRQPR